MMIKRVQTTIGGAVLAALALIPLTATGAVANAAPIQTPSATYTIPTQELPSASEQSKIQDGIKSASTTLADGQSVLVDTYRGVPVFAVKNGGLLSVQIGNGSKKTGLQPKFSFCADIEVPAVLAAIAAAGGAAAVLTGGIVLPEYGIVITAAQLQAAATGTTLVNALYGLVKSQIC